LDAGAVLSDRHTLIMRHTDLQYTNGFRRPGFLRRHEFLRKCAHVRGQQIPSSCRRDPLQGLSIRGPALSVNRACKENTAAMTAPTPRNRWFTLQTARLESPSILAI